MLIATFLVYIFQVNHEPLSYDFGIIWKKDYYREKNGRYRCERS